MSSISSVSSGYSMSGMQSMQHAHQKPSASQIADNLFSQLDTANQGYIEQSQFASAFSSADQSSAESIFSTMDADSDGKVTKTELTASLEEKMQAATDQFQTRMGMQQGTQQGGDMPPPPPGGQGGMPPGPPPADDQGFSKDELSEKASDESDPMSSLFSTLAENFDAADTDGDGKVTAKEAHAYEESQQQSTSSDSSTTATTTTASATSSSSSTKLNSELQRQLEALMRMYNINSASTTSSSVNASA